ncbi:MAG: hypothetical protein ACFE9R_10370 [Candidatus Hermodarchaeota archaeon]
MELVLLEWFQGSLSLVYVLITLVLSIIFIRKYNGINQKELLYVAIAFIGLAGPWFPEAFSFLIIILTNGSLSDEFYLNTAIVIYIIITAFTPVAITFWLHTTTKLLNLNARKLILRLILVAFVIFEALFFIALTINLNLIGTFISPFNYQESLIVTIFYLATMALVLITGILFGRGSLKSESSEIKLKGKLILIGLMLFLVGGFIPYLVFNIVSLIVARVILVFSILLFYAGFLLPKWIKTLFRV